MIDAAVSIRIPKWRISNRRHRRRRAVLLWSRNERVGGACTEPIGAVGRTMAPCLGVKKRCTQMCWHGRGRSSRSPSRHVDRRAAPPLIKTPPRPSPTPGHLKSSPETSAEPTPVPRSCPTKDPFVRSMALGARTPAPAAIRSLPATRTVSPRNGSPVVLPAWPRRPVPLILHSQEPRAVPIPIAARVPTIVVPPTASSCRRAARRGRGSLGARCAPGTCVCPQRTLPSARSTDRCAKPSRVAIP